MPVSSSTEHWIKPDALTINLNHFGDPDYLQVSLLAGAVVMAFKQDVIGYNAAHNYRTWPLNAANTYLETTSAVNVYAKLTRSEVNARALVVYDTVLRDIKGREITYKVDEETGEEVEVLGEANPDSFFVFLGQISASVNSNGESVQREWITDFRFGNLNTNQYQNEEAGGEWTTMFRLNKVTDMIDVFKTFTSAIFKKISIKKLKTEKFITDIKRSVDGESEYLLDEDGNILKDENGNELKDPEYVPLSDETIPTCAYLVKHGKEKYLSKTEEDTAKEKITFEKGVEIGSDKEGKGITYDKESKKATAIIDELKKLLLLQSDEFLQGELGSGFILKYDKEKKHSYFEIDEILVRKIAYFVSLVIKDLKHVGGSLILSPASMTCSKVEVYDTYYRCYFEQNDGEKTINNEFVAGDLARSQTFNVNEGVNNNVSNTYYWRYVVNVGEDFIDLSITDCDSGSGIPKKGDEIVQLGNRYDESRQNAIILSTVGDDAPSIKQYKGIKYYFLSNDNAVTFFSPSGNVIKGNFISASTGKNLDEEIKDIKIDWDKILEQTDKEFTLWFFPYEPTLDNLPASDWTSEELKQLHDQDMFFDDSTGQATSGKAWRFEKKNDAWGWYEITDAETIKALENIKQKKRVFVVQPTIDDAYDVGDLWICEEYGEMYKKEVLVCIQSKNKGESFSISHWAATVDETTSYIERLDKRITLAVTESKEGLEEAKNLAQNGIDSAYEAYQKALEALGLAGTANGKAEENTAAIQVNKNSITALANGIHFDKNGNITNINTSGLVVTSDFATLFSQAYNASDETVKRSEISTFVTSDEVGNMISGAYIGADQIYLNGYTIINDHFTVDADGNVTMHDFSAENGVFSGTVYADDGYFTGEINATSGTITGNLTVGSGSVPLIIQPTNSDSYPALVWQSDPKVFLQMGVYNVNGAVSGQAYFSDDDGNHTTIFPFSTVIHSAGYTSVLRGGQITIEDSEFKVTVDKCLHIYSPAWCLESKAIDGEVYVDGSGYVKVKNPIRV